MAKRSFRRLIKIASGGENEMLGGGGQPGRLEHFTHFWFFVGRSFVQNRCLIRAAALSYTTLLALIPLLAIAISITSSLLKKEGEQEIYKAIDKFVSQVVPPAVVTNAPSPEPLAAQAEFNSAQTNSARSAAGPANARVTVQNVAAQEIHQFIRNTRTGTLGITGVLLLIFVAISMLNSIEATFNDIWGVARGRTWLMRVARFWIALTVGPLVVAIALALAGGSHFQSTKAVLQTLPILGTLILQIATLVFVWFVFALIYQFVPNTKVQFNAALAGGVAAGTLWHLNNLFGFLYVSRVVTNSKIYGGLGLIPVFMAGLYLSWAVLLFGAEIAYTFQNRKIYLQEKVIETVSHRDREILALRLMTFIGCRFQNGEKPVSVQEISDKIGIPTKLVQQVLQRLLASELLAEIAADTAYSPARPLEVISAHDILAAMRMGGGSELDTPPGPDTVEILDEFEKIETAERTAAASVTLAALVKRRNLSRSGPWGDQPGNSDG